MKIFNKILPALVAVLAMAAFASCKNDAMEENTVLELSRCLQPMNLNARVQSAYGNKVTFRWDVTKDAESYNLVVYSDEEMTHEVLSKVLVPDEVPYVVDLDPDQSYYFKVQAVASGKTDSKWAEYDKAIKTYAVKDYLYLTVVDRQSTSLSFTWSTSVADYKDVDRLEVRVPDSEETVATKTLSAGEIEVAAASVDGLTPSTPYVVTLYFASASRGVVNVWTLPDKTGLTVVSDDAALKQAIIDGANIYLTMEGSPYTIASDADLAKGMDLTKGIKMYGEGSADGSRPVVYGDFNVVDAFDGGDLYFEGIEFNGLEGKCGFLMQHKEGSTSDGLKMGNVTFKNCGVTQYSKGLFYEWSKTVHVGEFKFESCDITLVNEDGVGGGDGFDLRYESTFDKISFIDCTIANGFRTFFRNYPQTSGNPAAKIGELNFINNTVSNLCAVNSTNNAGLFAFTEVPGAFNLKNNLFLNMADNATFVSVNTKYVPLGDLNTSASKNYFHNCVETFFNTNASLAMAAGKILTDAPCYNAAGGYFNILPDSDIAGEEIGASKWWVAYVEEPMDLRLEDVGATHTWNFADATYFSGTVKRAKVSDKLALYVENAPIAFEEGLLNFTTASAVTRKGIPTDGYLAFKVSQPGSVVIKPVNGKENHVVVAVGDVAQNDETTIKSSAVTVKGGASELVNGTTAQKILLSDITGESIVYVYASGPVALEKLAWSDDLAQVNTALEAPVVSVDPSTITAGEAQDVTVTWESVDYAGSYSVVFSGNTFPVEEGLTYTIPGQTIGFLDPGAYQVEVYANPREGDVYNTPSSAGTGAFAIVPKGGGGEEEEFIVKNSEELLAAIAAGKNAITLAPAEYDLGGILTVTAPLALKGQNGAIVKGAFKLSGAEVGDFSLENLTVDAAGQGIFIELDSAEGVTAGDVTVKNTVIKGFAKSVIYASNTADKFFLGDILFQGIEVYEQGTGQGMFDLRNGTYGSFRLIESTLTQGRDFLRIDGTCKIPTVYVGNNTMYNLNTSKNGNGVFYVRAEVSDYKVEKNLLLGMTSGTVIGKSGAKVPKMVRNYFFNCNDDIFFTGIMNKDEALGGQGVLLTVDPVKDAAANDFTLVNAVVMSAGVGAPKWNPSVVPPSDGAAMTVASAEEFQAAVDAGKTDIKFAAGEYDLSAANVTLVAGMHLSGEPGASVKVSQFDFAEGELGNILIEDLTLVGDDNNNLFNVPANAVVNNFTVRNCDVSHVKKSVFYGNGDPSSFQAIVFSNVMMSELGGGQGTFDLRKTAAGVLTIENCTVVGGRDFIRADANTVTGAVNIVNNTFDGVTLNNGNGVLYVRSAAESYVLKNNLFLNENGSNNLLSKTGVTVPNAVAANFFYNCTAEKFWTGAITQETALGGGGVILSGDPVKDAAAHDYMLVDALCLASNVGAARWNPNAGKTASEITVASVAEMANAIDAGKSALTLKAGTYDLRELAESGIITLIAPLLLSGKGTVEIIGGFKFGAGTTSFVAENIRFSGAEKAMGNAFEIAEAVEMSQIKIVGCDISAYSKSLFYGNGTDSKITLFDFEKNLVHGFGTGQGMIDIRKGAYATINVSKNTFYDGGRDFIRCDANIAGSIAITNNTFSACSLDAGNGLLWVRSCADAPEKYNVKRNLFLNMKGESGKTILAKTGATVPTMGQNYFFNLDAGFFGGAINQETATTGGAVLDADPCTASAEGNFRLVNAELKAGDVGDPRWNPSSPSYTKKK